MIKVQTLLFFLFISICNCIAQVDLKLGIPKDFVLTEKAVFFVDKNRGEINATIPVKEHPMSAVFNESENIIYIMTHHYIFKADGSTGNIIDEYQYVDILEKMPNEPVDPNLYYEPKGINKDGLALYTFNKEFREIGIKQQKQLNQSLAGQPVTNVAQTSNKYVELSHIKPSFIVDYKLKTVTPFKVYDDRETIPGYFCIDGFFKEISPKDKSCVFIDLTTRLEPDKKPTNYTYNLSSVDQLKNKTIVNEQPVSLSDQLYAVMVFTTSNKGMNQYTLLCNSSENKILHVYENNYQWIQQNNCKKIWHASKESAAKPMPKQPTLSIPEGLKKKEVEEYYAAHEKKLIDFQISLQEWSKAQSKPNTIIKLYNTLEMTKPIFKHKSRYGSAGVIYNDRYYLVHEFNGVVVSGYSMYDLTTGDIVYSLDLDF